MDFQQIFQNFGGWSRFMPYILGVLFIVLSYFFARFLANFVDRLVHHRGSPHAAAIASKLVFYLVFGGLFLTTLAQLGVELSGVLAAAGILTVAIGFAAQTSVSNVISGIFLYFDRPFSIDDTVRIGEVLGVVNSIDLMSTRIRTFDNLMIRIPNETLLKSTIINFTLYPARRIDVPLSVIHGSNLDICRQVLLDSLHDKFMILDEPAPVILVDHIDADGVQLVVRAWIDRSEYVLAKSALTQIAYEALQNAQIEIARPQRIVHLPKDPNEITPTLTHSKATRQDAPKDSPQGAT